ncbi:hypothetical protein BJX63DRAFT_153452 [Aspergillus granulosus]|uniref:Uncharacterized protein n=1 Tax=Aspergillus granulosus TaxID=176169 RepID=A0ABR4HKC8_9EURO
MSTDDLLTVLVWGETAGWLPRWRSSSGLAPDQSAIVSRSVPALACSGAAGSSCSPASMGWLLSLPTTDRCSRSQISFSSFRGRAEGLSESLAAPSHLHKPTGSQLTRAVAPVWRTTSSANTSACRLAFLEPYHDPRVCPSQCRLAKSPQIPAWFRLKSPIKTGRCRIDVQSPAICCCLLQLHPRALRSCCVKVRNSCSYSKQPPASANAKDLCPALSNEQPLRRCCQRSTRIFTFFLYLFFLSFRSRLRATICVSQDASDRLADPHRQLRRTRVRPPTDRHLQQSVLGRRDILVHSFGVT